MRTRAASLFVLALWAVSSGAFAVEGKWTPEQVLEHDPKWLRELGLQVPPEKLWSKEGGGLLEAAVRIDGCSSGFISPQGLMITNHHCAFGILQQHSTPEKDLITHGFLARTQAEELPGAGTRATIPHKATDVTAEIEAAVPKEADDLARYQAIDRKQKEMVAACEQAEHHRCQVASFDGGLRYVRVDSLEFPDVRLVYAPPRSVGEYGGEVDNWSWPRHTGDFALLRVYSGPGGEPAAHAPANVAYRPRHWFPVARKGVAPGAFVMVAASARDETARIALADRIKGLANNEKNSRGQVAGLRRWRILERKRSSEQEILAWAQGRPEHAAAV